MERPDPILGSAGPDRLVCLYSTPKFEPVKRLSTVCDED